MRCPELKMLQEVIARQDGFKDKTKNLAVTLFTAVSVGYLSGQVTLSSWQYLFACMGICLVFVVLEGVYGATEINAESRVREIESFLRSETTKYTGPAILNSLVRSESLGLMFLGVRRWRTLLLYVFLVVLAAMTARFIAPSIPGNRRDIEAQIEKLSRSSGNLEKTMEDFGYRLDAISHAPTPRVDSSGKRKR